MLVTGRNILRPLSSRISGNTFSKLFFLVSLIKRNTPTNPACQIHSQKSQFISRPFLPVPPVADWVVSNYTPPVITLT